MEKIIKPGKVEGHKVFCKITTKEESNQLKLSITGVIGPMRNGNAHGGGQIVMDWRGKNAHNPKVTFSPGWSQKLFDKFLDIWDKWHLNDIQAGCEHQRALGWNNYDEHPSEPCPTCGYKYGSAWLFMPIPQEVIDFLVALPETDETPAWI